MGPDDGIQRVLRTGLASAETYGVSIAVWTHSKKFFAEARVFARSSSSPEAKGIIDTLQVESDSCDRAVVLLEMEVEEKYGVLDRIHWWPTVGASIEVGQRVWVAEGNDRKVEGVIASVADDFLGAGAGGFVVQLSENKVVTCAKDRRGTQWDFATG